MENTESQRDLGKMNFNEIIGVMIKSETYVLNSVCRMELGTTNSALKDEGPVQKQRDHIPPLAHNGMVLVFLTD